jgi:putative ABC transport system ATP-binding protein
MIKTKNLTKIYESEAGKLTALDNVTLSIPKGEFIAITGRSGSGKSTLLYQLGLLDVPTGGTVHMDGVEVTALSDEERTKYRLKELGYVFQDYAILPSLTTLENVAIPLLMMNFSKTAANKKAMDALKRVGLEDKWRNLPSQLSGGQQQRVAIARAIAHEPKILFADEPTANLDTETSDMVLAVFLDLHKEGQTIVMVTHEKEYAALGGRIIVLSDGKIIDDISNPHHDKSLIKKII